MGEGGEMERIISGSQAHSRSLSLAQFKRALHEKVVPTFESYTNFLMMKFESQEQVQFLFLELQRRGVITRPLVQAGLPDCLRVSIGLPEENHRFISALEEIISAPSTSA